MPGSNIIQNTQARAGRSFFCAWSGGKDCCRALYEATKAGADAKALLTMCTQDGCRSLTHNLPMPVLNAQARALGIPLVSRRTDWQGYEDAFRAAVREFAHQGVHAGLTGDTEFGRNWLQRICGEHHMESWLPLWEADATAAFAEFLDLGFRAVVVAASDSKVGAQLAGRTLDRAMVAEFERKHIDVLGEYNEYHTLVIDGPIFHHPLDLTITNTHLINGYWLTEIDTAC